MQRRNTSWLTYRERFVLSTVHSLVRTDAQSWYNPGEIDAVVDIVQSLTSELPDMRQKEIAVITPWREQVWKLRAKLRESGFGGVDTGNVEVCCRLCPLSDAHGTDVSRRRIPRDHHQLCPVAGAVPSGGQANEHGLVQ